MSDTIEELRAKANKAWIALHAAEAAERDRENQAVIGKTFQSKGDE